MNFKCEIFHNNKLQNNAAKQILCLYVCNAYEKRDVMI